MGVVALGDPFAAAPFLLNFYYCRFMDIFDPDYINMRPIGGGQEPPVKPPPPEQIITAEYASVFDQAANKYEDWVLSAYRPFSDVRPINFAGGGQQQIIGLESGVDAAVQMISFVVGGETNITLYFGGLPISGPMDFGAAGEPRGMVMSFPYPGFKVKGNFSIGSSAAVQVSGMASFILF